MQDLRRMRYVTESYLNLQGLRWICWGGLCLLVAAEDADLIPTLFLLIVGIPLALALFWWSATYYTKQYGHVRQPANVQFDHLFLARNLHPAE